MKHQVTDVCASPYSLKEQRLLDRASKLLEREFKRGDTLTDPQQAGLYFRTKLSGYPYEVFACVFLDVQHRMIAFEELFRGSVDGAEVHPREIIRRCLVHNAAAVVFGHNHPSGMAEASAADRAITRRLTEALALIEVHVLDHFIVGNGLALSFAARGWL
jgi:DNA repair protein RadC